MIRIVFPPFVESALRGPHLAPPLLCAVLREQGYEAEDVDLNILMVRHVLTPEVLEGVRAELRESGWDEVSLYLNLVDALVEGKSPICESTHAVKVALAIVRKVFFCCPPTLQGCLRRVPSPETRLLYEPFIGGLLEGEPSVVGFSVAFSEQLPEAISLAHMLRAAGFAGVTAIGGSQINLLEKDQLELLAQSDLFDRISVGNGEQTIVSVVDDSEGKVTTSGIMSQPQIDSLPLPDFSDGPYFGERVLPVLVTKGCYWGKCTFCDYPRLAVLKGRYISRDANTVLEEIRTLQARHGSVLVNLISDAVPPAWYKRLASLAVERQVPLRSWSYMMHAEALDRPLLALMARAGVRSITFGTESTNDRILSVMKKQAGIEVIRRNVMDAHAEGIKVCANIIPDYPTTSFEEAIRVSEELVAMAPYLDEVSPQMFDLSAGTPIASNPERFSLDVSTSAYIRTNHGYHGLDFNGTLSDEEREWIKSRFDQVKRHIAIESRRAACDVSPEGEGVVSFDPTAVLVPPSSVWIVALRSLAQLDGRTFRTLTNLWRRNTRDFSLQLLRSAYARPGEDARVAFSEWLKSLCRVGLVMKIHPNVHCSLQSARTPERAGALTTR